MTLRDILHAKGSAVHTIGAGATLDDVVQRLVQHNCGSLVVVDPAETSRPRMVGIITERDILRACAARKAPLDQLPVTDTMTRDVITGGLQDSIDQVMDVMTERRVRHLPVMADGQLLGIVSIGDVVKARHRQTEFENHYLKSYIQS
jgi:CBS domain-containing protein